MPKNSRFSALLNKRHSLIPGAAHTYSKGDDQFPRTAPPAIVRGKGAYVWGTDGKKYLDWCMGLRSVLLGHAYEPVNRAVAKQMSLGTNFGRPAMIEFEFANELVKMLPNTDMVKFAKNGSTVTTAATKLARAFTGRKYIVVCSSQPFFSYDDWFVGTTQSPAGIPEEVRKLTLTFAYNDIASLERVFAEHQNEIACVILEVMAGDEPKDNFLQKVEALTHREGALLIIDEMITGFRYGFPALHDRYGLKPDLTTYGKGIANGYSLAILAGRKEVMELGGLEHKKERVFLVSTTHGAETTALAAGLAVLKEMKIKKIQPALVRYGTKLKKELEKLVIKHSLAEFVQLKGAVVNMSMVFKDRDGAVSPLLRTLFLQEVNKRGILFQGYFALSYSHGQRELQTTLKIFDKVLGEYSKIFASTDREAYLLGPIIRPVFRKYN